ncbi:hypothetical protein DL771_010039 [Neofusicoccum parvum]|nr:hypothetical protein DL771_010039 [Neofusicoccum parvum]
MATTTPKIIIAGGGITGLSLALMLQETSDIDFIILEAHDDIHPQVGAGIAFTANALRVFDQLGICDDILSHAKAPLDTVLGLGPDGTPLFEWSGLSNKMMERFGYPMVALDRKTVLEVLYNHVKDKSKILLSKRVVSISSSGEKVEVKTDDGSSYAGDMLVGADGIHSKVRSEMWRMARETDPGWLREEEQDPMSAANYCMFGISRMDGKIPAGVTCTSFGKDRSIAVLSGHCNRAYWFFNVPFGQKLYGKDIPRFSKEDQERFAEKYSDVNVFGDVKFGEFYKNRVRAVLTPLESHVFKKWHLGRVMIIGDAAHKLLPISGQGAGQGVESAAVLVNQIIHHLHASKSLSSPDTVQSIFDSTQSLRFARVSKFVKESDREIYLLCMPDIFSRIFCFNIMPRLGLEVILQTFANGIRPAARLESVPLPQRKSGLLKFSDECEEESKVAGKRSLRDTGIAVAGFLIACVVFRLLLETERLLHQATSSVISWRLSASHFGWPVGSSVTNETESWLSKNTAVMLPPSSRADAYVATMMAAPLMVMLVEGYRASAVLSMPHWPVVWGLLAQFVGLEAAFTIYFSTHILLSVTATFDEDRLNIMAPNRKLSGYSSQIICAVIFICYLPPQLIMLFSKHLLTDNMLSLPTWILSSPMIIIGLCFYLSATSNTDGAAGLASKKDGETHEGGGEATSVLRSSYAVIAVVLALTHIAAVNLSLADGVAAALQTSITTKIPFAMATVTWLLFSVYETMARIQKPNWTLLAIILSAIVVAGPGATIMSYCYWKEGVLDEVARKEDAAA